MAKQSGILNPLPELIPILAKKIWTEIQPYGSHDWRLPENKSLLEVIVGQEESQRVYDIADTALQNIEIRKLLSGPLKSSDHAFRVKAMNWVVVHWGRIPKGRDAYEGWAEQLKSYDKTTIDNFVQEKNGYRISSWSKILAFADCTNYAIYDSYVALALNSILEKVEHCERFYLPDPRPEPIKAKFKEIRTYVRSNYPRRHPVYMGYFDYMLLLKYFVKNGFAENVLEVEMNLFAQGHTLADSLNP